MIYDGSPTITDLEIIDPYLASRVQYLKDSYLDVKARLAGGATVIIEMQVLNVESFAKQVVYNTAKTYSTQLIRGEGYFNLKSVIVKSITDFQMFDNDREVSSHFVFKEKKRLFDYVDPEIELIFIELPKFNKQLDDLETLTDSKCSEESVTVAIRNTKGMSVSLSIEGLPPFRKPPKFGGTGKDPLWQIDYSKILGDIEAVQDSPTHVSILPSATMLLEKYEAALAQTQNEWEKV